MPPTYPRLGLWIGGRLEAGSSDAAEPVLNPATGVSLAELPHASCGDLDRALWSAEAAFDVWRAMTAYDRSRILERAADLIRTRAEIIATVMTLEQGKPLAEARGEVMHGADVIEWYAEEGRRAYGRVIPARDARALNLVALEPVGVSVAFTPWNFPALTPCRKIGGALAAGCTLVLKAAEETPGTAIEIVRAFVDAGLPDGVLNLVFGRPQDVSEHLIASPIVRKVSFTGSTPVGRQLMALCAADLKRTTMELGGHAPVVVCNDVDIDRTVATLVAGKYRNAGQVCISPTRFFVQQDILADFTAAFAAAADVLRLGDGLEEGVQMGPLANPRRVAAMDRLVTDARVRGAVVVSGGRRLAGPGCFHEPTVLADTPEDALVMREEPFGPLATISGFSTLDEALAGANRLPFGLAAYAFAGSMAGALATARGLKAGMVGVNTLAISTPESPFGGVGASGHGQEGGVEGLAAYQDIKAIMMAPSP